MTDDVREESGHTPVAEVPPPLPIPLELEAYYLSNQDAFHEFALAILRTNDLAEEAVHRAFVEIKRQWDSLLLEPDLPEQACSIMRRTVLDEVLGTFRESLPFMDSDIGLYPAMCKLSPRQFDVVVLKAIGKYDTKRIAWYMGLTPSTVTHHCWGWRPSRAPSPRGAGR
ncbi:sigma-70 family RNA polymerase sigma factor [Streptomyces sp. FL06-04B]|uniref:sigma-70 family RNA polymerase sigma factor n=1 Tax=unclassified Streptomyces TaxID=2593676 RepID=UPI0029A9ECD3|nr:MULTISPECIES: sigma-70 family RNA polymerase sigma factor [unclassified Streptomyces]MDX3610363.1 sigma-70 family RNA polymerase sigma factor [Streptomyces sp. FL06-04B]MDX3739630.1 sigma-70 family RNA polymerase sigma factor [Streptomyces sp. ID01-15D]